MTENASHPDDATRPVPPGEPTPVDPAAERPAAQHPAAAAGPAGTGPAGTGPAGTGPAAAGGPAAAASQPGPGGYPTGAPPTPWAAGRPPGSRAGGTRSREWGRDGRGGLIIAAVVGFLVGALLCGVAGVAIGVLGHRIGFAGRGDDRPNVRQWRGPGWQNGPKEPRRAPYAPYAPYPKPSPVPSATG